MPRAREYPSERENRMPKEANTLPAVFRELIARDCISAADIVKTQDGFYAAGKPISGILAEKGIFEFPGSDGTPRACDRFFDDWYIYAVPFGQEFAVSLFKLREQEHDAEEGVIADGDTPGVTVSFIAFSDAVLLACLDAPDAGNRKKLSDEINRVVAYRGQRHHEALKRYFAEPKAEGAYRIAALYVRHIASFARSGVLPVPDHYREIAARCRGGKCSGKHARLPRFIDSLNEETGRVLCDHENIYFAGGEKPTHAEARAILATHTGNVSFHSFAAEVEYHARFLVSPARIRIPFLGKSVYDSAIRADMTIADNEFEGPAPFYKADSKIVMRQKALHSEEVNI